VYQPGGTATKNVYTNFATMMGAVSAIQGDKWIKFDGTHGQLVVPPGTWNVDGCTFTIAGGYGGFSIGSNTGTLFLADGAHLTYQNLKIEQLWVVLNGNTPAVQAAPSSVLTLDLGASIFAGTGTAPFLRVSTNALPGVQLFLRGGATIGEGTKPVFEVDAAVVNAFMTLQDASFISPNAITGAGTLVTFLSDDAAIFPPQPIVTLVQSKQSDAVRVAYTPASLPHWSGVAPTSVADALDRIAAKITPIP
jgi:hypothetical protein